MLSVFNTFAQILSMKFPSPVSVGWLAELIGAELVGNTAGHATGINEIHKVEEGDIVFVDHPKYYDKCINSAASFIIINKQTEVPEGKALLVHDQPFEAYQTIVKHFRPFNPSTRPISETALIGEGTFIYPGCYVGNDVSIGNHCGGKFNFLVLTNPSIYYPPDFSGGFFFLACLDTSSSTSLTRSCRNFQQRAPNKP